MMWTTQPRSEVGGLAAIQRGVGRAVVLIHGVGLRAEAWSAQLGPLSDRAQFTAVDMPGHGESATAPTLRSLADYTDAIAHALAQLDGSVVVLGHSMGAMIALDLAARWPEHVRGVVALNAVFERSDDAARAVRARAAQLDGVAPTNPTEPLARWFGTDQSPERDACAEWLTRVDPASYKRAYKAFAESQTPRRDDLATLPCPALFMTGSLEPNSTPAMSEAMAACAPEGRAIIIDDAAHMMPMTHPDAVNQALMRFLDEVPA